ncbi:MAG: transcription-repair coupling factor [Spirochaetes bacterium]|nr:transcription-repair coupling factor [Spirochaetota bacterium]
MKKSNETFTHLPPQLLAVLEQSLQAAAAGDIAANFNALPLLAWLDFLRAPKSAKLWVVADDNTAIEFHDAWNSLAASTQPIETAALVSWGVIPYSYSLADREKEYRRMRAEFLIKSQTPALIIASVEGLTQYIATDTDSFAQGVLLKKSTLMQRTALVEFLSAAGYQNASPVTRPGEFCLKGNIIDIFPPDSDFALRVDFFGDEIESVKAFSHETQRSFREINEVRISPLKPVAHNLEKEITRLVQKQQASPIEMPPILATHGANLAGYADTYPALRSVTDISSLWQGQVYLTNSDAINSRLQALQNERQYLYEKSEGKFRLSPAELFVSSTQLINFFERARRVQEDTGAMREAQRFGGRLGLLKERIADAGAAHFVFFIASENQRERLLTAIPDISAQQIFPYYYPHGFEIDNLVLLTENDVFGRVVRKYAADKKISKILESYTDLKEGDYVVHVNYGVGRFAALKRMKVPATAQGGAGSPAPAIAKQSPRSERATNERDFLELVFADGDKLYVPLDQLNLVHKYIGSTENPRLDYLGKKSSWAKTRARVKRLVDSLAEELIELYALRQKEKGFAFGPDSTFQHDFEAAFPFTETEHQLTSIQAIKHDMESERPMDRLVCGDVGFGKTEIAIRAAFKAAMAGKQVAVLCPTTILAFQHYRSFSKRFADYPVRIDFISRFRTPSEIAEIKKKLADGKIDIVIGTHALLADDIKYKALGLLIVDEEQRFGVTHKEKLRKIRHNLDCLALTATPIPRTLHMSLTGIRDLSIIETPPAERRKIETHVLAENEELLRIALQRELDRGGQAYVLHNKAKTIEAQAMRLKALVPNARVAILHGQMPENEIEEVMVDFYQHAYDILVSTTIIESGIDIPNCNTLIVLGAHAFGLSQLYQLKGRVGRSDKQAYAYFFYPPPAIMPLNSDAERRLEVLAEYDDLGSGFRIAMKDLEIRGAGNLLGREQSGEISEIGFELYSQMLAEKIAELKGQKPEEGEFHSVITLQCDWYFPDDYIADTREKMEFYKAFSAAENLDEYRLAREALIDRFGKPPEVVELMLNYEEIRHLAEALRLARIGYDDELYAIVSADHRLDMQKLLALMTQDKRIRLDEKDPKRINFFIPTNTSTILFRELRSILKYLLGMTA